MFKPLNVIVCCDSSNGIGLNNKLPWKIRSEMNLFKKKTIEKGNNCVIMGKNTYLSIPESFRPLKERDNYIVSSSFNSTEDLHVLRNLDEDLEIILSKGNYDTYWVIGGESIYHKLIENKSNLIKEIHISILDNEFNCDTFFPKINTDIFKIVEKQRYEEDGYSHYVYRNSSYAS